MASATTQPIRVALAGLTAKSAGYTWLNNVHLPYLLSQPSIKIAAVLGSSKPAAEAAIAKFNLPGTVKAYGSAEDLAQDPGVDLVVVATKAPTHREIVKPSLNAGKDVFVEWPLDITHEGSMEMMEIAREKGVKTVVGLQGRYSAVVQRVAELVKTGKIGKVLSTTITGTVPTGDGVEREGVRYSLDKNSGATMVDIHVAHFLESMASALGELKEVSCVVKTMKPVTKIVDDKGEVIEAEFKKTAPDQVAMTGTFESGALMSFHMRGGSSIAGGFRWLIYGTDGEIEVTGPALLVHINMPVPWKVRISDGKVGIVEEEVTETEEGQPGVGRLWDAFLKGEERGWPDFEHAVRRHAVVKGVWDSVSDGKKVVL
jgi:predicted dehydrogenase